jgi:hypothetical protein
MKFYPSFSPRRGAVNETGDAVTAAERKEAHMRKHITQIGLVGLLSFGWATAASATITYYAYQNVDGQDGNQTYGNSIGHEFDAVAPVTVTQLGVFDDSGDGISGATTLTAVLWNRATLTPLATLTFNNSSPGTLVGSSRYKDLTTPITLTAGGQYAIVASGFDAANQLANTSQSPYATPGTVPWSVNNGDGRLLFVNRSPYHNTSPTAYPDTQNPATAYSAVPNSYAGPTFAYTIAGNVPDPIGLANPTATFEQAVPASGNPKYSVTRAIDGASGIGDSWEPSGHAVGGGTGWAIAPDGGGAATSQTAVFQTYERTAGLGGGTEFTFKLDFSGAFADHLMNNFRLSVTTEADPTVSSGATWTSLNPFSLEVFEITGSGGSRLVSGTASALMTLSADGNNVISASGTTLDFARYVIKANSSLTDITGFRLETGVGGTAPGLSSLNNFLLTDFNVTQQLVPEPSTAFLLGVGGWMAWRVRRGAGRRRM